MGRSDPAAPSVAPTRPGVKLGHVALDGTKMKANASKHKAMSYERMKREEKRLAQKAEELLRQAEARDALEDQKYGVGKLGSEVPEELRHAESRRARLRAAKAGPKAQRNFTDPDSRIQKTGDGFVQGYDCQAAEDEEHQIIVAEAVTNQPPDVERRLPYLRAADLPRA